MSPFSFAGKEIPAEPGQSIGAALFAAGHRSWRTTRVDGAPRGLSCGIGTCFDCLVTVNGRPNQRACLTNATTGDVVEPQEGTAHPTGAAKPAEPHTFPDFADRPITVDTVGPADPTSLAWSADSADPARLASPAGLASSAEFVGPFDSADPADPAGPAGLASSAEFVGPSDSADPAGAAGPAGLASADSAGPSDPAGIANPVCIAGPASLADSAGPADSAAPTSLPSPAGPSPAGLASPAGPVDIADSAGPAGPASLARPAGFASSADFVGPSDSADPAGSASPAGLASPAYIAGPVGPVDIAGAADSAGTAATSGAAGFAGTAGTVRAAGTADVLVIGAGPAGLAAASAAQRAGARVVLLDAGPRPGGQFWRHRPGHAPDHPLLDAVAELDFRPGHAVWHVERTAAGFVAHATAGEVPARTVVVATGAYDRQVPFPGWTLPGVVTAGGAQALLKGHGVLAGERVVVAGTGPFLLPVAAGLAGAGSRVLGVFEAGSPLGFVRHPLAVLRDPGKAAEGAGYLRVLRRHRVPYRTRATVLAAHGEDRVTAVTVASLDRGRRTVPGSERRLDCDAVAVGFGFTPQVELALQLGAATHVDGDGSLVAIADDRQRASVPGVYLAGEVCGVGGAQLSIVEGEIAGRHAAGAAVGGRSRRRRAVLRAFASALHDTFRVGDGWLDRLDDRTVVCRCEEVPVSAIRHAVHDLGATEARTVKLLARPGMGLCQGRVCGYATACLTANANGRPVTCSDLLGLSARPIAAPVTLGSLAEQEESA